MLTQWLLFAVPIAMTLVLIAWLDKRAMRREGERTRREIEAQALHASLAVRPGLRAAKRFPAGLDPKLEQLGDEFHVTSDDGTGCLAFGIGATPSQAWAAWAEQLIEDAYAERCIDAVARRKS